MKRILLSMLSMLAMLRAFQQEKKDSFLVLVPVEVSAVRAGEKTPFAKTNLSKQEIEKLNIGQDLPFILNQTPGVVINSDAGNGVGYTGIRIRGTDATRINVTLNGIPYNDAESQGTYFVDLPDFASSVNSIQVQRGVGTSSNGSGAFGASINISSNEVNKQHYAELNNSYGSFNTWKNTIKAGTGLIKDHFTVDIRLSNITSDGYIDRAATDLKSFYFSTAYLNDKSSLRLNVFSGKEKTYQAWNGVSESMLKTDRTYNLSGTEKPGEPYNNETDNYIQTHYQLFFTQQLSKNLSFNTALFLSRGKGYYEEYKGGENYAAYQQPFPVYGTDTVLTTDLVRQLWLDNYYYGDIFSLQLKTRRSQFILGGSWNKYDGNHYGDLIWAANGLAAPTRRWYDLDATKTDATVYLKQQTQFASNWNLFYDLQFRHVKYDLGGFRENPTLYINTNYNFLNPKIGISFSKNSWNGYLSYSRGSKEPNRDDFEAGLTKQPKAEKLNDFELSVGTYRPGFHWNATFYYMQYKDQLVLTGQINDVGAYTRTNIPNSYRSGIELEGMLIVSKRFNASANISFSKNKVRNFTEYVDDYDNGGQKTYSHREADIAFSPSVVAGATIAYKAVKNLELNAISKFVDREYLDNTENDQRKLNAFYTQDIRAVYTIGKGILKNTSLVLQVNNLFNRKYEPNGYTYSYIYGGALTTENYYFPMAGTNFMFAVNLKL